LIAGVVAIAACGCEQKAAKPQAATPETPLAPSGMRGKYLVVVAGCNDCHTAGFSEKGGSVPESQWLMGTPVGWRGPWGTTYSSNLRRFVKDMDEDTWVQVIRARSSRPPMPWPSLHAMDDRDLRSTFRFIKSLQPLGDPTPEYLPPGAEPKTPYLEMTPRNLDAAPASQGK
jgi:mono/diheme cytochrome c family protein